MLRRGSFAGIIAMLAGMLVLHVSVSMAGRKSRGACAGANTVPVDEVTRRQATGATLCLVNRLRARHHLRRVRVSVDLTLAALQHSGDMVRHTYFAHDAPGGETFAVRMSRNGYMHSHPRCSLSEAMAWGMNATARSLVNTLEHSPPHRAILLDRAQRDVGIGLWLGAPVARVGSPSSTLVLSFGH
jgi:uncharacterized protein YkwD